MLEFPRGGAANEVPRGEKKLPCALVVDTSGSLKNHEGELREGVKKLVAELQNNQATAAVVEIMLILFDDKVRIVSPFGNIRSLVVPEFDTGGRTSLYEALDVAYSEIRVRQEEYVQIGGINSYAPFLVLLTDGHPTDTDNGIVSKVRERHEAKKLVPLPFAVGGNADEEMLKSLRADHHAFRVGMQDLASLFEFVSVSLSSIATNDPNATIPKTIALL